MARNTLEQQRAYNKARRTKLKQSGLVRVEVWVLPKHKELVRDYAHKLVTSHEQERNKHKKSHEKPTQPLDM